MIFPARWLGVALLAATSGAHAACFVAAVGLQFGAVNPSSPTDSIGSVSVTCTDAPGALVRYSVSLSAGSAAAFAPRRMTSSDGATLHYNLYANAARTLVWGDGNGGTVNVTDAYSSIGSTVTRHYPVYGRISGAESVPAGAYGDSILISLDF